MKKNTVITIIIAVLLCVVFLGFGPLSVNADGDKRESNSEDAYFENPVAVTFVDASGNSKELILNANTSIGREKFPSPFPEGEPAAEGVEWYWADAGGNEFTADTTVTSDMAVTAVSRQKVKVTFIDYSGIVKEVKELYAGGTIEELPSAEPDNASSFVPGKEWYWIDENENEFTADTPVTSVMEVRSVWKQDVSFEGSDSITVYSYSASDAKFPELPDSEKEGGWKSGENIYDAGSALVLNGDILAAYFSPYYKVTVTFDLNQGTDFINNSGYEHTVVQEKDVEGKTVTVYKIHVYPGTTINLDQFKAVGRPNRTFLAWTDVPKNQRNQTYISEITPNGDVHVYGMWGSTITFVSSNNDVVAKYIGYVGGNNPWIAKAPEYVDGIKVGTSFTVPALPTIPQGRTFKGWADSQGAASVKYGQNDIGQSKSFLQNNTIFYPVFQESVKVTFDKNGGGDVPKARMYLPGDEVVEEASRLGHTFRGWNTDKNAETGIVPFIIPEDQTGELTLYAMWRVNDPNTKFGLMLDNKNLPADPTASSLDVGLFTSGKIPQSETSVAVWETVNVLRKDNVKDGIQVATADTTIVYDAPDSGSNTVSNDVTGALKSIPTDPEILRIFPTYDSDTQFVLWYYLQTKIKKIGGEEYRHVDGAVLDKKLNITVAAEDKTKFYGELDPALTLTASAQDLYNTDIAVKAEYDPDTQKWTVKTTGSGRLLAVCTPVIGTDGTVDTNGNTLYSIAPACVSELPAKFIVTETSGTLTVKPVVTVTAADQTKVYGTPDNLTAKIELNGVDQEAVCSSSVCTVTINSRTVTCTLGHDGGEDVGDDHQITASCTGLSDNYRVDTDLGKLAIIKQGITVTAVNAGKIYNTEDPQFTFTVTKTGSSETAVVDGLTVTVTRPEAAAQTNVGTYTGALVPSVTINGEVPGPDGTCGNYVVAVVNGDFTISQQPVRIEAENQSKVYGDTDDLHAIIKANGVDQHAVCSGSICNVTIDEIPVTCTLGHSGGENVGNDYQITAVCTGLSANYSLDDSGLGKLTITPKAVTITADANQGKVYGQTGEPLTAAVTMDGTNLSSNCTNGQCTVDTGIGDPITYSISRVSGENVGEYAITVTSGSTNNYSITCTGNVYTITPAEAAVTADAKTKKYGEEDPVLTATVTGMVNGDTASVISYDPPVRLDGENVGEYPISVSGESVQGNYNVRYVSGAFTITAAEAKVKADDLSKVYGEEDPQLTAKVTGLVNGDTADVITYNTPVRKEGLNVGSYEITVDGQSVQGNYNVAYEPGTFTITQKPIVIKAASAEKVYDGKPLTKDAIDSLTLPYGDTVSSITVSGSQTLVGQHDNIAGDAVITDKDGNDVTDNYIIAEYKNGTLTVTKKPLTITAADDVKYYDGTPLSNDGYTNSELADGDRIESVTVTGSQTVVGKSKNVASDAVIRNAADEDVTKCYEIDYVDGELEVAMAQNLIITAGSGKKVYDGTALVNGAYTVSGLAEGHRLDSVTITGTQTSVGTSSNVPSGAVIRDGNGTDVSGNYTINYRPGTLEVTRKSVSVIADDDVKVYDGTPLYKDSYHHTELAQGDRIVSVTVTGMRTGIGTAENVPSDAVFENAKGEDVTANYAISYVKGNLYVRAKPVTVTVNDLSKEFGQLDPEFTAAVDGVLPGDTIEYQLSREEGEEPGEYVITASGSRINGNYEVTYVSGTLTITYNPTAYTFEKVWDDDNNRDGLRPASFSVTLVSSDGRTYSRRLSRDNNWTVTIADLPLYSAGTRITYRWEEEPVEGYTSAQTVSGNVTISTSTHAIVRTTSSVNVIWDDKDNKVGTRPTSLTVVLRGNDRSVLRTTVNADTGWAATAVNLPLNENGAPINYVWYEQALDANYYAVSSTTSNRNTTLVNSNLYRLTIHYRYNDGREAAQDYVDTLAAGETFVIESPVITGFVANPVSAVGIMPAAPAEIIVVYAAAGEEVIRQPGERTQEEETVIIQKEVPQPREQMVTDDEHTIVLMVPTRVIDIEEYGTALGLGDVYMTIGGTFSFE